MSFCAYYNAGACRSCSRIERSYEEQLSAKQSALLDALGFLPSLSSCLDSPVRSETSGFRDRAKMAVTGTLDHPIIGLVGEKDLDRGRDLSSCPIQHPWLSCLFNALPAWIARHGLVPYQIARRKGELKGLIAFYSPETRQAYLRVVLRSHALTAAVRSGLPDLQSVFPELACVSVNIQPVPHAQLEGPEEVLLTEPGWIAHRWSRTPIELRLAPQAFVQTNTQVAGELYATAAEWIAESGAKRAAELYCGQGAFSFFAAARASARGQDLRMLGLEANEQAIVSARESALALGLSNLEFERADATEAATLGRLSDWDPELLLVNPPRRGIGPTGVELVRKLAPRDLIYSSCDVESLSADLRALLGDYSRVERARLFDMFPHTEHFETLVWLRR